MKTAITWTALASVAMLTVAGIISADAAEIPKETPKPEEPATTRPAVPSLPGVPGVPGLPVKWDGRVPLAV